MKTFFTCFIIFSCALSFGQGSSQSVKEKVFTLYRFFEKQHYKPVVWNDSSSSVLFNKLLEETDQYKLYFTKQDIDILEQYRYKLDEEVTGKKWSFYPVFAGLFKTRIKQADSISKIVLSKPVDVLTNRTMQWHFADYASTLNQISERRKEYYTWKILSGLADTLVHFKKAQIKPGTVPQESKSIIDAERQELVKEEAYFFQQVSDGKTLEEDVAEMFLKAVCWTYDPHTEYMNYAENQSFQSAVTASEYSTGINFEKDKDGIWTIEYLVPGGPAWRSGLVHTGDKVTSFTVGGKEVMTSELDDRKFAAIIDRPGTDKLIFTIKNAAGTEQKVTLIKEQLSNDEDIVKGFLLQGKQKIGYIQLPGFYSQSEDEESFKGCANDVAKEIIKLKKDGIAGLILDLRNNGGGSMWEAMELAGIFINDGPLGIFKNKDGKQVSLRDPNRGTIYDGKLLVLINGTSASASEFLSAALQDYNRALIVGGNTYGKGTAQQVLPLDTSASLQRDKKTSDFIKVTGQTFYRVDGSTVQWKGVLPDVVLPDFYQQERIKERFHLSALKPDFCKQVTFTKLSPLPVYDLAAKSSSRVSNSSYFNMINKFLDFQKIAEQTRNIPLRWDLYAEHYEKRRQLVEGLSVNDTNYVAKFKPANHSFDDERKSYLSKHTLELNTEWLERLKHDQHLDESYQIMLDWIEIK